MANHQWQNYDYAFTPDDDSSTGGKVVKLVGQGQAGIGAWLRSRRDDQSDGAVQSVQCCCG